MSKRKRFDLPKFSDSTDEPVAKKKNEEASNEEHKEVAKAPVRNFPHVEGNWPTFVSVDVQVPDTLLEQSQTYLQESLSARGIESTDIFAVESPHLSLTKTFPLREHEIDPFFQAVSRALACHDAFPAMLHGLKLYWSENESRVFSSVLLGRGRRAFLSMLASVDKVVADFSKPTFYEDPEPHVSLCWAVWDFDSNCRQDKNCDANKLEENKQEQTHETSEPRRPVLSTVACMQLDIHVVTLRSGNRTKLIHLNKPT